MLLQAPFAKGHFALNFCLKPSLHTQHNYNQKENRSNHEYLPCLDGYSHAQLRMFAW